MLLRKVLFIAGLLAAFTLLSLQTQASLTQTESLSIDPAELEVFLDEFFNEQMTELDIPGAAIVVIQNGRVLVAKGYGFADVEQQIPFDSDETVVRIGSVSKPFVATAIMQLVEQGRLDLHTDVNHYLTTFQIDETFPEPITTAHLLTHGAGFDSLPFTFNMNPDNLQALEHIVSSTIPTRIRPSGEVITYSNYGYALLGYLVESITGVSFDQYVLDNILLPLGMNHSRYFYAPPAPDGLAVGYSFLDIIEGIPHLRNERLPQPPDYDSEYPGGSLTVTTADMARFMLAHLGDGCYEAVCILNSTDDMHQQQFTNHPALDGHTYGFREMSQHGYRMIEHSGATLGFGNELILIPEENLGFFLTFNLECIGSSACRIIGEFRTQFMDQFFPTETEPPVKIANPTNTDIFVGNYRYFWYQHVPADKPPVLSQPDLPITAYEDGVLLVNNQQFVEIDPLVFQEVYGSRLLSFRLDEDGRVKYLFYGGTYERLP